MEPVSLSPELFNSSACKLLVNSGMAWSFHMKTWAATYNLIAKIDALFIED
jgi:hypothetical protein